MRNQLQSLLRMTWSLVLACYKYTRSLYACRTPHYDGFLTSQHPKKAEHLKHVYIFASHEYEEVTVLPLAFPRNIYAI
jgi:hypothetical protein